MWTFSYCLFNEVTTHFECNQVITALFWPIKQRVVVRDKYLAEPNISQSLGILGNYIVLFLITKVSLIVVFIYDLVPLLAV
jgi:hypothetical protein